MSFRLKRGIAALLSGAALLIIMLSVVPEATPQQSISQTEAPSTPVEGSTEVLNAATGASLADNLGNWSLAKQTLAALPVKGKAAKTGYERSQFGNGWKTVDGCSMRETILHRDMTNVVLNDECQVMSGTLLDPYTSKTIQFSRGANSSDVQIDHVVALSNAWQTGAQQLTPDVRATLANDPLELLAVDGSANQQKSDADAATWLPSNKAFRCEYVTRQVAIKQRYTLWVTQAERDVISRVLAVCTQ